MRITREQIRALLPGQKLVAKCIDTAEWLSANRIAQYAKKDCPREDGEAYLVSSDSKENTVTVEVTNISQRNGRKEVTNETV